MIQLIKRTILDRKNSIIMFIGAGVALLWLYVAMFPFFQEIGTEFVKFWESIEGLGEVFTITDEIFQSIENFLAMEQYAIMIPLLLVFLLIGIAGYGLSGDVENGTAEIILARPISRLGIFFGRYFAGMIVLLLFVAFTSLMIVPFGELHNLEYSLDKFISISILVFLFGWAIFSIAMLVSALYSERSKVSMYIGGGIIAMYVMNIVATTQDKFDFIQYLSFFYYYDHEAAILENSLATSSIVVFIVVAIIATVIGAWWYNKRDVAISA